MKIHHLCCGTMCPWSGRLLPALFPAEAVCHCLLIETDDGLVLVDTGLGTRDLQDPRRLGVTALVMGVQRRVEDAAIHQVTRLGFDPRDVRHLVPTHLDLDHAGGLVDFPWAEVHTLKAEHAAAMARPRLLDRHRYRTCHWTAETRWQLHAEAGGERWFGFDAVRQLPGLPPELLLIPIPGHTRGHFGVAVQTPDGWLLHAGDAYYDQREITGDGKALAGWRLFQRTVHDDHALAMRNQARLRALATDPAITLFPAHDPTRFAALAARSTG